MHPKDAPDMLKIPGIRDLVEMYHTYANTCTKQEEKFDGAKYAYTWADCEAAYNLLCDECGKFGAWLLWDVWRRQA